MLTYCLAANKPSIKRKSADLYMPAEQGAEMMPFFASDACASVTRSASTPELRSLESAVPAEQIALGTPVVEARPVEIDYFCCCCSRVKEPPLFSL